MKLHNTKFDSHHVKERFNVAMGLDPQAGTTTSKVRNGEIGGGKIHMSERVIALVNKRWKDVVESNLGFKSYAEMRIAINTRLGRPGHLTHLPDVSS